MALGRPKGSLNKIGAHVKEDILAVFTRLGGTAAMAEWARKNPRDFYTKLYAKLIPTEATVQMDVRKGDELTRQELLEIAASVKAAQEATEAKSIQ